MPSTYFIRSLTPCYYVSITTKSLFPSGYSRSEELRWYKLGSYSQSIWAQISVLVSVSFLTHSWNEDNNDANNDNEDSIYPQSWFQEEMNYYSKMLTSIFGKCKFSLNIISLKYSISWTLSYFFQIHFLENNEYMIYNIETTVQTT